MTQENCKKRKLDMSGGFKPKMNLHGNIDVSHDKEMERIRLDYDRTSFVSIIDAIDQYGVRTPILGSVNFKAEELN
jgi:hypothetical protein